MPRSKIIAVLAIPDVQLLDVAGPLDVITEANAQLGGNFYKPIVVGMSNTPVRSSAGMQLMPDVSLADTSALKIDTLLVAGSPSMPDFRPSTELVGWLQTQAKTVRRIGSVCSGAFLLGSAQLLSGRRATTHWSMAQEFRRRYPDVLLEEDAIFVHDRKLRTAAGVTAGLDLSLSLVEEDCGVAVAKSVSNQLVMYFRRTGGQLQFSRQGGTAQTGRAALQELQRWVAAHPDQEHSVVNLAKRLRLSSRHFSRVFRSEFGLSPARWVERIRVDVARDHLENRGATPKQAAGLCGFSNVDHLRRAFMAHLGVTPAQYRKSFSTSVGE
ncbi:GlxA family transcriptional regulator [Frateuria aurantia]